MVRNFINCLVLVIYFLFVFVSCILLLSHIQIEEGIGMLQLMKYGESFTKLLLHYLLLAKKDFHVWAENAF